MGTIPAMSYTRRDFGKLALASLPAAAFAGRGGLLGAVQTKPNSLVEGVQIGLITYSFRSMPDQSAEATLRYVVDSGVSAIELMGGPVESFAGAPPALRSPDGRGAQGGGAGAPAGRGGQGMTQPPQSGAKLMGSWNGEPCEVPTGRGGAGGRGAPSAEQQDYANRLRAWRTSVSMEPFKKLRRMYNDAGVTIYAWKQLSTSMSDDELEYVFNVAEALGCTHTTVELPTDPAQLKHLGDLAVSKKIYAAYHTHAQGSMTAFDAAFAASKGNKANVDFGHWIAAPDPGGTPAQFLEKYHDRIASFHLKDRTKPEHCALNLPWGKGETPINEILQLVKTRRWRMPASIELEYEIPSGSNAVAEVRRCLDYCRQALTA